LIQRRDAGENRAVVGWFVVVVLALTLAMGCGGDDARNEPRRSTPKITGAGVTGSGRLVDVGGRSLYVECTGSGSPTILLEAGFGGRSGNWAAVFPELAQTTRTCAYDRAGLGSSVAVPGVHDAGDEIKDLERLLDRARIEPPYVLVGNSYGGLLVRLFARAHPDKTAGVVLVDAIGRDATRRLLALWPTSLAPALRRSWAEPVVEGVDLAASEALDRSLRSLGGKPLVVITAGRPGELFAELPSRLRGRAQRLSRAMQTELAGLSSDHAHVVAQTSGHFVQAADQQPLVVIRAAQAVVRAHRDRAQLPPCERLFRGPDVRCLS
jgi:pimeloyl-ACP methyl ester carboxylesterase